MTGTVVDNLLVVKIGGAEGVDLARCADDLAQIEARRPVIVVHGASAAADRLCRERGIPVRTLTSPGGHSARYTDRATRDVFVEAAESVNRTLVDRLERGGVAALGMTGDRVPLWGERKTAIRAVIDGRVRIVRDDYSGIVERVEVRRLLALLHDGICPVIAPIAASADGFLNVDGDRASAAVAGALGASELVILSGVRGVYRHFPDENSFVNHVEQREVDQALDWAQGRMKRKVISAAEALERGVPRVIIADGRAASPVTRALNGEGTEFTR